MESFEYRLAVGDDFDKIVLLQNQNLATVLTVVQKSDGFLSSAFSAEQLRQMAENVAVVVARNGDDVIGFVCASTAEFNAQRPLVAAMIARFSDVVIEKKRLVELKNFITGPVCVDKNYRGQGVFEALYGTLFRHVPAEYQTALSLVSTANPRSVKAHEKLGMKPIDSFNFDGREFLIIARMIR